MFGTYKILGGGRSEIDPRLSNSINLDTIERRETSLQTDNGPKSQPVMTGEADVSQDDFYMFR